MKEPQSTRVCRPVCNPSEEHRRSRELVDLEAMRARFRKDRSWVLVEGFFDLCYHSSAIMGIYSE